jgi:hypothetical protein
MHNAFKINKSVALLTQHGKQMIIGPLMSNALAVQLRHTDQYDTDQLGTFNNTVPRLLSPVETALKKAYLACELTHCTQGLGSEGTFTGTISGATLNQEIMAFVDLERSIEVLGFGEQYIALRPIAAKNEVELGEKLQPFIEAFGMHQKWLLEQNGQWLKGLDFSQLLEAITVWPCCIEPDFRAMNCPSRRETIALATKDLINSLQSHCPQCGMINFVQKYDPAVERYLPCEFCAGKTTKLKPAPHKCDACGFIKQDENAPQSASVIFCTICNP